MRRTHSYARRDGRVNRKIKMPTKLFPTTPEIIREMREPLYGYWCLTATVQQCKRLCIIFEEMSKRCTRQHCAITYTVRTSLEFCHKFWGREPANLCPTYKTFLFGCWQCWFNGTWQSWSWKRDIWARRDGCMFEIEGWKYPWRVQNPKRLAPLSGNIFWVDLDCRNSNKRRQRWWIWATLVIELQMRMDDLYSHSLQNNERRFVMNETTGPTPAQLSYSIAATSKDQDDGSTERDDV